VDAGGADARLDAGPGVLLTPSATGFVQDATSGVVGSWYPFADGIGPNPTPSDIDDVAGSDCVAHGHFPRVACSTVLAPVGAGPFAPDPTTGAMCTSGVAAQVLTDSNGAFDYSDLWGAGIGLDFNNPGGDAGAKGPWDASAFTGIAFDFWGTQIPTSSMRVLFPFVGEHGTDAPYSQGASQMYSMLTNGSRIVIHWQDVAGPLYLTYQTPPIEPPRFDPTKLLSIQFLVTTNGVSSTPYSFCVANLTLLTAPS
jgi:hypothetical protein